MGLISEARPRGLPTRKPIYRFAADDQPVNALRTRKDFDERLHQGEHGSGDAAGRQ